MAFGCNKVTLGWPSIIGRPAGPYTIIGEEKVKKGEGGEKSRRFVRFFCKIRT